MVQTGLDNVGYQDLRKLFACIFSILVGRQFRKTMQNWSTVLSLLVLPLIPNLVAAQEAFPKTSLENENLAISVYLPDEEHGFYRAARFDWSGVIGSIKHRGHEYVSLWLDSHDPLNQESITGPVEAFSPIGFEDCTPGETFLIIGVGLLEKPDEKPYHFAVPYKIADHGKWTVEEADHEVRFIQELDDHQGISYQYTKSLVIDQSRPRFTLDHELKNTGSDPLQGTVYNHNFFIIDDEPTGPNIKTSFPYPIHAEGRGFGEMITAKDSSLNFLRYLNKGESVYTANVEGWSNTAKDYQINIENLKSGAGMNIRANRPLYKMAYWACHSTACPEPFIEINVAPGEAFSWSIEYEFYLKE